MSDFDDLKMKQILVSIRSDDEEEEEKPQISKKPVQQPPKPETFNSNFDDDHQFDIKESIDFGHQDFPKKKTSDTQERLPTFGGNQGSEQLSQQSDGTSSYWASSDTHELNDSWPSSSSGYHVQTNFSKIKKSSQATTNEKSSSQEKVVQEKKVEVKLTVKNEDENLIQIGKSMYTSKPMSTIRSPTKNLNVEKNQPPETEKAMYGIQESVYLTSQPLKKKIKGIEFQPMQNRYFWKHKEKTMQISFNTIKIIMEQFFKIGIVVPIIEQEQYNSDHFDLLLSRYTDFLNYSLQEEFVKIFINLKERKVESLQQESYRKILSDFAFRKKNYSKLQQIKAFLTNKISSLKLILASCGQFEKEIKQKLKVCEKQLVNLQLMISFEKGDKFCEARTGNNIDQNTWKTSHQKLKEMRKKWIEKERLLIEI